MQPHPQLSTFLQPYDSGIQHLVLELRGFILQTVPKCNELIWDNYNAVAIAYSLSEQLKDAFCHLSVYANHVNFGFNRGSELPKTSLVLSGNGKLIRHLSVKSVEDFPETAVTTLVYAALGIAEKRNPSLSEVNFEPKSIVMSISDKKRRPN